MTKGTNQDILIEIAGMKQQIADIPDIKKKIDRILETLSSLLTSMTVAQEQRKTDEQQHLDMKESIKDHSKRIEILELGMADRARWEKDITQKMEPLSKLFWSVITCGILGLIVGLLSLFSQHNLFSK